MSALLSYVLRMLFSNKGGEAKKLKTIVHHRPKVQIVGGICTCLAFVFASSMSESSTKEWNRRSEPKFTEAIIPKMEIKGTSNRCSWELRGYRNLFVKVKYAQPPRGRDADLNDQRRMLLVQLGLGFVHVSRKAKSSTMASTLRLLPLDGFAFPLKQDRRRG